MTPEHIDPPSRPACLPADCFWVCLGASGLPFGHLLALEIALLLALVLVLGVIGGPFGGSGEVREICIKVAGFDTDVRIASEWAAASVGRHARCHLTGSRVVVSNPRFFIKLLLRLHPELPLLLGAGTV